MSHHIYAITANDGPVMIGSYETAAAAQAACRREQRVLRDGGYAEDVTAIELQSGDAGDTQTPDGSESEGTQNETGKDSV